ncbi:MAG: flagellar hook-associated protein FlgK, partial [Synergistaceae bacterium]|nr:flagellar hook-associated protein FlgK [Synergistaceae bacterium]
MGKRALNAFRLGMDTVGHNVSNMNTEGYSRQRVNYATVTPQDIPNTGQLGQGVTVNEIKRIRDDFLDLQFRANQDDLGYWSKINDLYDALQNYIGEPDSEGVRAALDTFYSAVQSVQQTPESSAARRSLVESAQSLGNALDVVTTGFDNYAKAVNADVKSAVDEANEILHEIAALNKVIYRAEATNQNANDYLDQRDLLIDKLSSMIDMTYQEPLTYGDRKGEFFLTLHGRALIQGDHVRELKAHAFQWDNQVYYDVQVAENEFDIISDCTVADVLATGPEGVHQLIVDRLANGKEWDAGGGDAYCMDTVEVTTAQFKNGILLDSNSDTKIPRKISIRAFKDGNTPVVLTVKIDHDADKGWVLRAEKDTDGNQFYPASGAGVTVTLNGEDKDVIDFGSNFTIDNLKKFIDDAITADSDFANLKVTANHDDNNVNTSLTISSGDNTAITVNDYSGMLGALSVKQNINTNVPMRVRPADTDEALGLTGSFRLQVGTQGTRVTSVNLNKDHGDFAAGDILGPGTAGDRPTMRIGAAGDQLDITASWNNSTQKWELTSDIFVAGVGNTPSTYPVSTSTSKLTIEELADFISQAAKAELSVSDSGGFVVKSGPATGTQTQFYIESRNNYLMSISDVEGNLAETLGMVNTNPVIEIDVEESDTLEIIRNKINEKYQAEFGLTEPEQWVHASLKQDSDQSWYLSIAANVPGEAQRITLMGDTSGDMQLLRRLGLV